jgi:hypothetical protein
MAVFEKWRQIAIANVTVLIDGGTDYRTAMLTVPRGVIRSSAEE